jgi:hypothetical protein
LGNTFGYGYDRAGNRESVTVNGVSESFSFNAANQRTDFAYDAAGNLLGYGHAQAYSYDALGRMTSQQGETLAYNGDGVLVQAGSTFYTQDLVAPLSQVLGETRGGEEMRYLYGRDRLASLDAASARTWELHDALGSVRHTLDDAGNPIYASGYGYNPFGVPQSGAARRPHLRPGVWLWLAAHPVRPPGGE